MPAWIHNRAEHLLAKNPDMTKSKAFAIATQQSHALGKSPKGYGTAEGKHEAKMKYDTPKDDVKGANPGGLESSKMAAFWEELYKDAAGRASIPEVVAEKYKAFPAARRQALIDRMGGALEKLRTSKIDPLHGKVHGFLSEQGGKPLQTAKAQLGGLHERYDLINRARKAAVDVKPLVKGGSYNYMRAELAKLADAIPGGKADAKTDKDFDRQQLSMGEEVEQEHAKGNRTLAREIARDHLQEIPDYYTRLKRMEDAAPKRKEGSAGRLAELERLQAPLRQELDQAKAEYEQAVAHAAATRPSVGRTVATLGGGALLGGGLGYGGVRALGGEPRLRALGATLGGLGGLVGAAHLDEAVNARHSAATGPGIRAALLKKNDIYGRLDPLLEEETHLRGWDSIPKEAMDPDHPYLLDQVGKPKTRNLSAMPPDKSLVVKKAAATGVYGLPLPRDPMMGKLKVDAAKRLQQSQKIGVPKPPETKPLSVKVAVAWGPSMQRVALGAGLGVAGGAAAGAAAGGEGHRVKGALLGGLGGGAVGAGAGYAAPRYMAGRKAGLSAGQAAQSVGQDVRANVGSWMRDTGQSMHQGVLREQHQAAQASHNAARASRAAPPAPLTAATRIPAQVPAPPSGVVTGAHSPQALQKAAAAKLAWTESMYSGGMGMGGNLVHTNIIPPFVNPPVKTAGPPPPPAEKKAVITKLAAMADELMKLNAVNATTPGGRLAQSRKVGQPRTTPPPGPSVSQIAKPVGYGSPEPGTTKVGTAYPKERA